MSNNEIVKLATLRQLVTSGGVRGVSVVGLKGGYAVNVRYGLSERILAGKDGDARLFKSIDTAANTLRDIGIAAFDVDALNYEPGRIRSSRPDLAERMRSRHESAAHDEWFRSQVQQALDNPNPQFVSHDATVAQLTDYAAQLVKGKKTTAKRAALSKTQPRKATARKVR
ncbi:hypothetical protein [Xanthomonas nasturtii]|uniref:hypothetical protein n=1 Tax=Xanthomonas nasturtii TaxID=1843581 RepID=UPI002011C743|nr:hypothetical protein [Xanthomonas nasturtii]MCL1574866.1 hypothetical protein [Xanthomonas nasturtii]MCL1586486.1 hypothetical protein [Xanthomonas nasturtii]